MLGWDLGLIAIILTKAARGSTQPLQANTGLVSQLVPNRFLSNPFYFLTDHHAIIQVCRIYLDTYTIAKLPKI
jgi:hypothetical protein